MITIIVPNVIMIFALNAWILQKERKHIPKINNQHIKYKKKIFEATWKKVNLTMLGS